MTDILLNSTHDATLAKLVKADGRSNALTQSFAPMTIAELAKGTFSYATWITHVCTAAKAQSAKGKHNEQALRDAGLGSLYRIAQTAKRCFAPLGPDGSTAYSTYPAVAAVVDAYAMLVTDDIRIAWAIIRDADETIAKASQCYRDAVTLGDGMAQGLASKALRKAIAKAKALFMGEVYGERAASFEAFVKAIDKAMKVPVPDSDASEGEGEGEGEGETPSQPLTSIDTFKQAIAALEGLSDKGLIGHEQAIAALALAVVAATGKIAAIHAASVESEAMTGTNG